MLKLYESAFLLTRKLGTDTEPSEEDIIAKFPEEIEFDVKEKDVFFIDSDPKFDFSGSQEHEAIFHAFNINCDYYFSFSFVFENSLNSIIIRSVFPFAYMYASFFKEANQMFEKEHFTDPQLRFAYITSLLQTWDNNFKKEIEVNFPTGLTSVALNEDHFTFSQYNPSVYFKYGELMQLYSAFMYNEPILIIAKNGVEASEVSFSLFSLLCPLQYCGPFAIWMPKEDKRLKDISASHFLYVCTNDSEQKNNPYFKHILEVKNERYPSNIEYKPSVRARTKYFGSLFGTELDSQLVDDPWSDTLFVPLNLERTKSIAAQAFGMPFDQKAAEAFNSSESWKMWRKRMKWRSEWLESMKSCDPNEVMQRHKTKEERDLIKETLSNIPEDLQADKHLMAVVKNYKKIIDSGK